ncbi:MAG TPA: cupredoxin domain-containing protein, partial [Candidatus Dormibacteraeota bacterium]|nr:cupredoxin domain-containing protein [Candidatus Dormibacteraeota bacterium]
QTHGNNVLEIVWTLIPTLIVAFLFVLSWRTLGDVDTANAATSDVRVRATAARFQWTFEYLAADGQTVQLKQLAPELVVPAGQTVHLDLRSPDVIHAFYVPQFLFKRDVIPGRDNAFDFKVDPQFAGQTFRGQCAELCGAYHWTMQFTVKALAPADFQAWLQQAIAAAAKPSPSPAASGAPTGATLQLSAHNVQYDQSSLEASAGQAFTLKFTNSDAGVPHNVSIHQGSATGPEVFRGEIFPGVDVRSYAVPALPAGTYAFVCSVHPNMNGTLTVK